MQINKVTYTIELNREELDFIMSLCQNPMPSFEFLENKTGGAELVNKIMSHAQDDEPLDVREMRIKIFEDIKRALQHGR